MIESFVAYSKPPFSIVVVMRLCKNNNYQTNTVGFGHIHAILRNSLNFADRQKMNTTDL
jgi:hypothetical protein